MSIHAFYLLCYIYLLVMSWTVIFTFHSVWWLLLFECFENFANFAISWQGRNICLEKRAFKLLLSCFVLLQNKIIRRFFGEKRWREYSYSHRLLKMLANWIENFMLKDRWTKYKAIYRSGIILLAFVLICFAKGCQYIFFKNIVPHICCLN